MSNDQLVIRQEERYQVPLEDIGILMLESHAIVLTVALLNACTKHKIAVFVCDDKHLPSGMLLGYQQHSRQAEAIASQLAWTKPFKRRLWQLVVKWKINNQAYVIRKVKDSAYPEFTRYANEVGSGDPLNREATAARHYFRELLPANSTRNSEDRINSALDYGYAIVRGALARSIASYGFLGSVGIHHANMLNNYNLADDLMEPYRPFVDLFVFTSLASGNTERLSVEDRARLVEILVSDVCIGNTTQSLLRATELTVQSLVTATEAKDVFALRLPSFDYSL